MRGSLWDVLWYPYGGVRPKSTVSNDEEVEDNVFHYWKAIYFLLFCLPSSLDVNFAGC